MKPFRASVSRQESILSAFDQLWLDLFSSPVHLDSALSKLKPPIKSVLAKIVPRILLRPASLAAELGVGLPPGEPWCLDSMALRKWRPARMMAERMIGQDLHQLNDAACPDDFPPDMVEEWRRNWGSDAGQRLAQVLGLEAPLGLRANRSPGAGALLKALTEGSRLGVKARLSAVSPQGVRLEGYAPVLAHPLFEAGAFEIQDEGSQVMAYFAIWPDQFSALLRSEPTEIDQTQKAALKMPEPPSRPLTVVDACAGAGGKSLAFSDALAGKGRIYAYDISDRKLTALRKRAKRAGMTNIQAVTVQEGAESTVLARFKGTADIVLVDAPCSGWGVLRRNPDIKWRQTPDALERLPEVQLRLLSEYSKLVMPGGILVFGVCTFRAAETTSVVTRFLSEQSDFIPGPGGYLGPGRTDGFFMQSFTRTGGGL